MESSLKTLYLFFSFFFALLSSSHAYTFNVGGREGWILHPSENYNQWSGRLRFIVKDALHFKYNAADSVLEVNKGDYDNCNTTNPITKLAGGDSYFTLNRSGPFYFISGNKSNCDQGQKLTVVVISPKSKGSPPPAMAASPPGSSSPLPSESPISSPPQPGTTIPATPSSSPSGSSSPTSSPSDSSSPAGTPAYSPGGSGSSSPAGTPAYSPGGSGSSSPAGSPANSPGGSAASSPTGNPADVNAPPPAGSSSEKLAVSAIFTFPVAIFIFGFGFLH